MKKKKSTMSRVKNKKKRLGVKKGSNKLKSTIFERDGSSK